MRTWPCLPSQQFPNESMVTSVKFSSIQPNVHLVKYGARYEYIGLYKVITFGSKDHDGVSCVIILSGLLSSCKTLDRKISIRYIVNIQILIIAALISRRIQTSKKLFENLADMSTLSIFIHLSPSSFQWILVLFCFSSFLLLCRCKLQNLSKQKSKQNFPVTPLCYAFRNTNISKGPGRVHDQIFLQGVLH